MACGDFTYSENGRRGIGVNQPQSGLHYPFVHPSADVRHLIADFYLAYESLNTTYTHPLKISWLYGLGCLPAAAPIGAPSPTHPVDLVITDSSNNIVFNSTTSTSFDTWKWGERHPNADAAAIYDYQIYQWVAAKSVCRLVAYRTWVTPELVGADEDVATNYPIHVAPQFAVLDERCVYKMPKRINSIRVINGSSVSSKLTGEIDFEYGYNTTLTATPQITSGQRRVNSVTMQVSPGSGLGKYFDCPETPDNFVYSINGLTGPNILIGASDCLWLATPPDGPLNSINVLLASNCPACCGCNDYVQVGNYMNRTADRYRPIGDAVQTIVTEHTDNIERWLRQTDCRLGRPLQLDITRQRCPFLDIVAQYCNQCSECATNVKFRITIETFKLDEFGITVPFANPANVICGRTNVTTPYEGTRLESVTKTNEPGGLQVFTAEIGKVDIGNSGKLDFRLRFAEATPTIIQIGLTATTSPDNNVANETAIKADCGAGEDLIVVLNTSLRCSDDGTTIELNC